MHLFIIKLFIFLVAILSSIGLYHFFTHKIQNEILFLTEEFQEAYKNQNYFLLNQMVADDLLNTSSEYKGSYNKSNFLYRN